MPYRIRRVEYYHANVRDDLGSAYRVLHQVAGLGVDLFAFAAVPSGPDLAQLTLFPEDPGKLIAEARTAHPQSTVPTTLCWYRGTTSSASLRLCTSASLGRASTSTRPRA